MTSDQSLLLLLVLGQQNQKVMDDQSQRSGYSVTNPCLLLLVLGQHGQVGEIKGWISGPIPVCYC